MPSLFLYCRQLVPCWATLPASFLVGFFLPPVSLRPDRGLLNGSSFRAVLCSGFAVVCVLQTVSAMLGDTSSVVPCWFFLAPSQPSA